MPGDSVHISLSVDKYKYKYSGYGDERIFQDTEYYFEEIEQELKISYIETFNWQKLLDNIRNAVASKNDNLLNIQTFEMESDQDPTTMIDSYYVLQTNKAVGRDTVL